MNIALISHPTYPIPPYDGYGGVQRGIYDLTIGLANRGHTIYLFCSKSSKIVHPNIHKISIVERGLAEQELDYIEIPSEETIIQTISNELDSLIADNKIDIINARWEDSTIQAVCKSKGLPLLMSVHCHIPNHYRHILYDEDLPYSFHTATHKQAHPEFKNSVVNEYAIAMDHIPISEHTLSELNSFPTDASIFLKDIWERRTDYLVYVSGVRKQKSQASALAIAKKAQLPIVLAGSPSNKVDIEYYNNQIKPLIDGTSVIYLPNINEKDKYNLIKYAKGFIFAAGQEDETWVEPFGRVISESLATGTPVVGYKHGGSVLHQVQHGKNGYLYQTIEEAVHYIHALGRINRMYVAQDARERLTINKFIDATEQTLQSTIQSYTKTQVSSVI